MARQPKISCNRCDGRLGEGPYCPKCGYPTPWASHDDRIEWELRQWSKRDHSATAASAVPPAESAALTAALETAVASPASRRWFRSRKSAAETSGRQAERHDPTVHAAEILESIEMLVESAVEDHPAAEVAEHEISPFAPPVEKALTREPRTATPAGPTVIHPKRPARAKARAGAADAIKMSSPLAPTKSREAAPARKPSTKRKAAKREPVVAETVETPPGVPAHPAPDANVTSMRAARRLPSLADIEQMATEGPPLTKIVRLLCAHIAVLEAQIPEDVAKTG